MKRKVLSVILNIAFVILGICLIVMLSVRAYRFGKSVFDEREGTAAKPLAVTIEIREDTGINAVAAALEQYGLIRDRYAFIVQKYFYGSDLVPGKYRLDTNMTGRMILDVISGVSEETEGQT